MLLRLLIQLGLVVALLGRRAMPRRARAGERRNLERVLPYIIQIPGIDPKWLAKEVLKRMDDKLDLDSALAEGTKSIVAQNGLKDANGAAGQGQAAAALQCVLRPYPAAAVRDGPGRVDAL